MDFTYCEDYSIIINGAFELMREGKKNPNIYLFLY